MTTTLQDGWGYPCKKANKQHFIRGGVSLCGRHTIPEGPFIWTTEMGFLDLQCRECERRLERMEAKAEGETNAT